MGDTVNRILSVQFFKDVVRDIVRILYNPIRIL